MLLLSHSEKFSKSNWRGTGGESPSATRNPEWGGEDILMRVFSWSMTLTRQISVDAYVFVDDS